MGISVTTADTAGPLPRGVVVTIECDEAKEFFCRGFEHFVHPDGFVGCHAAAMKAGWLERQGPQGRIWLCPTCSGK